MHGDGDSVAVDIGVDCHKLISWVGLRRSGGRDTLGSGSVEERRMICFLLNDYCEVVFSDFVHVKNKFFFHTEDCEATNYVRLVVTPFVNQYGSNELTMRRSVASLTDAV